jgi:hypothetical protein
MAPVTQAAKVEEVICGRTSSQVEDTRLNLINLTQTRAIDKANSDFKFIETVQHLFERRRSEVRRQIVDLNDSVLPPVEDLINLRTQDYVKKIDRLNAEDKNLEEQAVLIKKIRNTAIDESGSGKMVIQRPELVFKQKDLPENFVKAKDLRINQFCESSEVKFKVIDSEVQRRSKYIASLRKAAQALESEPKLSFWVSEARKPMDK